MILWGEGKGLCRVVGAKTWAAAPGWKSDCSGLVTWVRDCWKVCMSEWMEEGCGFREGLLERRLLSSISAFHLMEMHKILREVEFWWLCPHSLCSVGFFYAGLIYNQWSWTSQESRWEEEPKNRRLCMHRDCIRSSFWEMQPFYWILMAQALCLAIFWTAPGARSLTPTVFCISIGFCAPFRFSLKHYVNNCRVNTGVCNGAFKLKRLLDSCK